MKAVMLSIRPEWCDKIAFRSKTIEVRKTRPKLKTPFKCYIYCTKGYPVLWKDGEEVFIGDSQYEWLVNTPDMLNGKVIGEFVCDAVYLWNQDIHDNDTITLESAADKACLTEDALMRYADGYFYGWHISELKIYDHPKLLCEFYKNGTLTNDEYINTLYDGYKTYGEYLFTQVLRKPPQSWCYVEDAEGW